MTTKILAAALLMGILTPWTSTGMAYAQSDAEQEPRWKVDMVESWEGMNKDTLKNWEKTEFEAPPALDTVALFSQNTPGIQQPVAFRVTTH